MHPKAAVLTICVHKNLHRLRISSQLLSDAFVNLSVSGSYSAYTALRGRGNPSREHATVLRRTYLEVIFQQRQGEAEAPTIDACRAALFFEHVLVREGSSLSADDVYEHNSELRNSADGQNTHRVQHLIWLTSQEPVCSCIVERTTLSIANCHG